MINFDVKFDSRNKYFRKPSGALSKGSTLELLLEVSGFVNVTKAEVVVLYDRHSEPAYYEMHKVKDGKLAAYSTFFQIDDTGLYWYYFQIHTDLGFHIIERNEYNGAVVKTDTDEVNPWQLTIYDAEFDEPEWIYGGVYYHIFVDRFYKSGKYVPDPSEIERLQNHKGLPPRVIRDDWGGMPEYLPIKGRICNNDFFGGNLKGIEEKLPYLKDLGITCLYLSPIFEGYSNHKYDTGDYYKVDPSFGTEEDFQSLCAAAEKLGIKVVLDGVFSHTGSDSIYFDKYGNYGGHGAFSDPESKYRDWFDLYEDGTYETWWGIDTLPRVRKENKSYQEFITGKGGVVPYWIEKGASGWRLDVVDELPSDFTKAVCSAARGVKADALMIGEVWEDASSKEAYDERKNYFEGDKLNSVMNYPLKDAMIEFLRNGRADLLKEVIECQMENYPPFAINSMMNILDSHDSVRILTALAGRELEKDAPRELKASTFMSPEELAKGKELLKLAVVLFMTVPGVPSVYYGDEAGMEGYADPFNRKCYPWGKEDQELLSWYKKIIHIRTSYNLYKKGGYATLAADKGFFGFARFCDNKTIITAVNTNPYECWLNLTGGFEDILSGRKFDNNIPVQPGEAMLLLKIMNQI